jgi:hypothetical protein
MHGKAQLAYPEPVADSAQDPVVDCAARRGTVVHECSLHHGPNWTAASASELRARVTAVLDGP